MKRFLLAISALCFVLLSCSKDDNDDYKKHNIVGSVWESRTELDITFTSKDIAIMTFSDPYEVAHEFTYTLSYPTASFTPTENADHYEFTAIFKSDDRMEITVYLLNNKTETHLYQRK